MPLVELGRFDRQEAYIVQSRLEAEGLMSFVFDSNATLVAGSYLLIPVRVLVDEDDLAAAQAIIGT